MTLHSNFGSIGERCLRQVKRAKQPHFNMYINNHISICTHEHGHNASMGRAGSLPPGPRTDLNHRAGVVDGTILEVARLAIEHIN